MLTLLANLIDLPILRYTEYVRCRLANIEILA